MGPNNFTKSIILSLLSTLTSILANTDQNDSEGDKTTERIYTAN